jgi:flagellin-like hook-associated protein FlgL
MANQISLTAGTRQNLLLLQQTAASLSNTQLRLSTGNKVNSALDGPQQFFAAKSLNQRAGDLDNLKDNIGQAISTLKAGDQGITNIQDLLDQAKGLTTQALSSLGTDANSVKLRNNLANQYNSLLRQIDKLANDSGYAGKNLLVGSGLSLNSTQSSEQAVNALGGLSGATVSNVTAADTYTIAITGDGAISGSTGDIQNAQQLRGISNLTLSGFDSTATGNFDSVSIKLAGGKGKDKTFTITEGSVSQTVTFTQAQAAAADAKGQVLHASVAFASGTHVNFDVDFTTVEDTPDTAGVGTSVIEKLVNLQVKATNSAGETVTRDGLNLLGQGKTANGENAFAFSTGTARVTVDERQLVTGSTYAVGTSNSYGTGAGAIAAQPVITSGSANVNKDTSFTITSTATSGAFNYATNTFDTFSVALTGAGSTGTVVAVSANNATAVSLDQGGASTTGTNAATYTLNLNLADLQRLTTATAANSAEIGSTVQASGLSSGSAKINFSGSAFVADSVTTVTFTYDTTTSADNATVVIHDSTGGSASVTGLNLSAAAAQTISANLVGGSNAGAAVSIIVASVGVANAGTFSISTKVRGAFDGKDPANQAVVAGFDVRAAHTGATAKLVTKQLVDGNEANNLTVQFNETNTSSVTVVSQNVQTNGQGLKLDQAQNGWNDRSDIDNAVQQLDAAKLTLRSASSNLSTNLNVIQTRETYTAAFSNVLKEGAGKLTLADQNEEGANLLTLQTRNQLGTISLSLANQAQQAILRLF